MKIPFIDFSEQYKIIKDELDGSLKKIFEKGNFILGEEAVLFEEQFAKYCDSRYAVGVNSGTDALYLALASLDVSVGDEVIIPTFTFIATALCISYTGATPVLVDVEEKTFNIDPQKLRKAITENTKAIIPVHLYGQPANMDEINKIAKENNITVIEDACQSHGATYNGKKVGALGDISCFSFYPTKSLGAFGDGGIVVTAEKAIYEKVKMLRDYGRVDRYNHKIKGYNSRLDTIQAAVLLAKLKYLDQWNSMRREHADLYGKLLSGVEGIQLPATMPDRTHVFQTFAVRLKNRDQILESLKAKDIGALIHYPIPIHMQEAYADLGYKEGDFPVSESMAREELSLPMFPHMKTQQVQYVCDAVKEALQKNLKASNA